MKIGIQTWGSYGDIRPFLALAEGLQSAGHDVTLAVTSVDSPLSDLSVSRRDVKIRPVASPVIGDRGALMDIEETIFNEADPVRQTQTIIENLFLPAEAPMYDAAQRLCTENDLVIGHFFHYPLQVAAIRSGHPYVSVALVHSAIPSAFRPPAGLPNLGAFVNRLGWRIVKSVLNKKLKRYADHLRAKHGVRLASDVMEDVWASKRLTLVAVSPEICAPLSDWPEYYRVCGFLNRDGRDLEGEVDSELQAFLLRGEPPVYITLGSVMWGRRPKDMISLLRHAAELASVRAVIQAPGWQEYGFKCGDSFHYVDAAPHAAIFPRCQAVVHHGGAGTAQSALLAGKPSVVVTHTSEQEFWGKELARLKVSPKPISRRRLTAHGLAEKIRYVLDSELLKENAMAIAGGMARENGVATAIELINEKFID